jgi:hypothetical protein
MINKGSNILTEHKKNRLKFDGELKQINFLDTRVYQRAEDKFYPSVTSILQYFPKDRFFETWMKDVGHNADFIMRKAADEGTQVHNAIERLIDGEEVNWMDDYGNANFNLTVWEMILKFGEFWKTYKPIPIATENFLYSDTYEYAGTADLVCMIDNERWLIDFKTSNSLHTSYDLQVAAYAKAWEELGGEPIQRAGILWLKSSKRGASKQKGKIQGDGWELKEVSNIGESFESFETILKLYRIVNPNIEPIYRKYPTILKL